LLAGLVLGLAGSAGALFHLRLEKSSPAKDQRLGASPREIRLWFSEKPELRLSTITVVTSDSVAVKLSKVRPTDDPLSLAADVTDSMVPGTYLVKWKTSSRDGHAIRGTYSFHIGK
jgi:methionine-rich copper-binding protein CopC